MQDKAEGQGEKLALKVAIYSKKLQNKCLNDGVLAQFTELLPIMQQAWIQCPELCKLGMVAQALGRWKQEDKDSPLSLAPQWVPEEPGLQETL